MTLTQAFVVVPRRQAQPVLGIWDQVASSPLKGQVPPCSTVSGSNLRHPTHWNLVRPTGACSHFRTLP
ncbi:hypothetical protein CBM2634_U20078 [Cupriavidus taiwanensis]|uniref:Uncharacterized protein n=1 Tax=Cupriavidus taiwanensis TaxID=164546 RepID=A0A375JF99_9BURK|nr:hypothetical protein CBM2634_U20078 [Cupriavidus taiwanensis]